MSKSNKLYIIPSGGEKEIDDITENIFASNSIKELIKMVDYNLDIEEFDEKSVDVYQLTKVGSLQIGDTKFVPINRKN